MIKIEEISSELSEEEREFLKWFVSHPEMEKMFEKGKVIAKEILEEIEIDLPVYLPYFTSSEKRPVAFFIFVGKVTKKVGVRCRDVAPVLYHLLKEFEMDPEVVIGELKAQKPEKKEEWHIWIEAGGEIVDSVIDLLFVPSEQKREYYVPWIKFKVEL